MKVLLLKDGSQKMNNVVELDEFRKRKKLQDKMKKLDENITELKDLESTIKHVIISLTKYEKYSMIRRRMDDLYYVYKDVQKMVLSREDVKQRLNNEL